ncbi:MAG: ferric reductase-like transmembrane domain-containing protein [Desulfomonile sp.]|nr:ferric reductase-like transmembrane domain-containing protein [Desulfomonile sp.]
MVNGMALAALYCLISLSPLLGVAVLRMKSDMTVMHDVGTSTAFAAYGIMALQPVLVSRWKWVERPFGLDVLSRFHRYMGVFAAVLLLTHPPLMAFGGAGIALLTEIVQPWYIWLGRVVLSLLIVQVIVSLLWKAFGLTFEKWRSIHNVLAVIILGGAFIHSWFAAYDLWLPMRFLWVVLFGITLYAYVYRRVLKPRELARTPYRIESVTQETHNVWTVKLVPPQGKKIYDYEPGQFHFITLQRGGGLPIEEHHWTISSSPAQKNYISSTIKESGDFTKTIGQTRPGDTALVEGPFGRFSYTLYPEDRDFVFIAGGIGITPLMAMLRHMRDTAKEAKVLLLYANHSEKNIVFRSEIAEIAADGTPQLEVVHILSNPELGWNGEIGRLDHAKLAGLVGPEKRERAFYVCAPPKMADSVTKGLRLLGVSHRNIRTERFSL